MIRSRRYDLDWLRIFAFGVLIYFHTAIIFIPDAIPMVRNNELSDGLQTFVSISSQFRLSLLFFISGVGVAFARRNRTVSEFVVERSQRLLIPLFFSVLVVVPPMVYTEKLFIGEYSGSLIDFYGQVFTTGVYPAGNLSWHHMWFVAYLYIFCLLGVYLFEWFEKDDAQKLTGLTETMQGYRIFLPVLPLWVIELFLRPIFPGFRDLIHDWASFSHWFVVFVCGYLIANRESLLDFTNQILMKSIALAVTSIGLMYLLFGGMEFSVNMSDPSLPPKYFVNSLLRVVMVWSSILAFLGIVGRYFRFSSSVLDYLNEAVYPLFILHLPVIVILGFWIVQLEWGVWSKYLLIANLTGPVILMFYHFLIRPFDQMRLLFGVKKKQFAMQITKELQTIETVPPYES